MFRKFFLLDIIIAWFALPQKAGLEHGAFTLWPFSPRGVHAFAGHHVRQGAGGSF